jgi:hypothetical protein
MKTRNGFFCLAALLLLAQLGAGGPPQKGGPMRARVSVRGRVVGYSLAAGLRMINGSTLGTPHDELLFMVEEGDGDLRRLKFIKLRYRPAPQRPEELPESLFTESRQRSFVVERDQTCDESAKSFIKGHTFEPEARRAGKQVEYQNLQRLPGTENLPLPEKGTFRCYVFGWDGWER